MYSPDLKKYLQNEISEIQDSGLFKKERIITTPQDAVIKISTGKVILRPTIIWD